MGTVEKHELVFWEQSTHFLQEFRYVLLVGGSDLEVPVWGGLQRTLERGYFELAVHTVEWAIRAERLPLHEKTLPTRLARDVKGHPVDCGGFLRLFARFFAIELDVIGQAASLHVGGLSGDLAARHGEQLDHRSSD